MLFKVDSDQCDSNIWRLDKLQKTNRTFLPFEFQDMKLLYVSLPFCLDFCVGTAHIIIPHVNYPVIIGCAAKGQRQTGSTLSIALQCFTCLQHGARGNAVASCFTPHSSIHCQNINTNHIKSPLQLGLKTIYYLDVSNIFYFEKE